MKSDSSWLGVAGGIALIACGSDSPTDPNSVLEGLWTYSTGEYQLPDGDTCSVSEVIFRIEQDGMHFSGTIVQEGTISCNGPNGSRTGATDLDIVSNGEFDGEAITFQFFGDDITNEGTLNGDTMHGTVLIAEDFLTTTTFMAVRLNS